MSRGRFAPSPTGGLHLGNARTALIAWWRARAAGSSFVLRVEDLDPPRTVPDAVDGNLRELAWLGIDWDEGPDVGGPHAPYRQSQRGDRYRAAVERLAAAERLFPCWLSRRELRRIASAPHGAAPVYGDRERAASLAARAAAEASGKRPAWRLSVPAGEVAWEDRLLGPRRMDLATEVGHVALVRADGLFAYALAVVVDDAAMGIQEVVRGDDLADATGAQLALYQALSWTPPAYAHVPLLRDPDGERLAKRQRAGTLAALQAAHVRPERVVGLLAFSLGLLPKAQEVTAAELIPISDRLDLRRAARPLGPRALAWATAAA